MSGQMAFTYRNCDCCVSLARRILKKRKSISWWELEASLLIHQTDHEPEAHPLCIYPAIRTIPVTDNRELTGMLFIKLPDMLYETENKIQGYVALKGVTDISRLQNYIWKSSKCYWLNLQIIWNKGVIYALLELVDDVDIKLLSQILAGPKVYKPR